MGVFLFNWHWQESLSVPPVSSFSHVSTGWPQCCYAPTTPLVCIIHAALPFPCCCGFSKEPKTGFYSCSKKKSKVKKKQPPHNSALWVFPLFFLFKRECAFCQWVDHSFLGLYHVLGFLWPSQLSRCCMYRRMKALQKTCLMKKMNLKILFKWTVALLTRARHCTSSQLHVKKIGTAQRFLPSTGELLILDNIHISLSVQCNNCVQVSFLFVFPQLVPRLYQNTFRRILLKRTILTLSICYRVYIVLTLKPDWLLFNILLSNIKILSFFLKDEIQ